MNVPTAAKTESGATPAPIVTERLTFGSTDLRVSPLGIGCARIGGVFQGDSGAFVSLIGRALDAGINFFDTADMYSGGESESILGRAFAGKRDRVVIASKVGYVLPAQRRLAGRIKPLLGPVIRMLGLSRSKLPASVRGAPSQNFSPDYIKSAVESSLVRLRTDHIDVLQLHSPPADVIRRGDWSRVLESLKRSGKVRYYGIACRTAEDALLALEHPDVAAIQVTVNLLETSAVDTVLPAARGRGVAVIARECLANGVLVKEPHEIDASVMFSSAEEASRKLRLAASYRDAAERRGLPLATLALKYALAQEGVSTALVGVRTPAHLDGALRWFASADVPAAAFIVES